MPLLHWPKCLETSGSGPRVTIPPIRDIPRHRARSASITANLWPTSSCCAADRVPPRSRISGLPIGTFSLLMLVGSSWASGWPERSERKLYPPRLSECSDTACGRAQSLAAYSSTSHISMDRMTTLQGNPLNNAYATVVKDSHADRGTLRQTIPVS